MLTSELPFLDHEDDIQDHPEAGERCEPARGQDRHGQHRDDDLGRGGAEEVRLGQRQHRKDGGERQAGVRDGRLPRHRGSRLRAAKERRCPALPAAHAHPSIVAGEGRHGISRES